MKNLIVTLIILLACLSIVETSFAGEAPGTVSTYGYTNYYPDGSTPSAYSNPVSFSSNATTSTYGNTFTHSNTTYGADGAISSTYGNTTYFSGNASGTALPYKNPFHK